MRVVFPIEGSVILLKQDLETLVAFYNTNLITSKMNDYYKTSKSIVQVGSFNYIPKDHFILMFNTTPLDLSTMRQILDLTSGKENPEAPTKSETAKANKVETDSNKKISDDDIMSNPFFTTLKPVDEKKWGTKNEKKSC